MNNILQLESKWDEYTSQLAQSVKRFANVEGQLTDQILALAALRDFNRASEIMLSVSAQLDGLLTIMQGQIDDWVVSDKDLLEYINNENNQTIRTRYEAAHELINHSSTAAIEGTTKFYSSALDLSRSNIQSNLASASGQLSQVLERALKLFQVINQNTKK